MKKVALLIIMTILSAIIVQSTSIIHRKGTNIQDNIRLVSLIPEEYLKGID